MTTPKNNFVAISDIHFGLKTLPLATRSLERAISEAEVLDIPLVVAGDLQNDKDHMSMIVQNKIISTLKSTKVPVFILSGNHDLINEKGKEHALEYLRPYATIVDEITYSEDLDVWFIPYQNSKQAFEDKINSLPHPGCKLVFHQGIAGAAMGDYAMDKTSVHPSTLAEHKGITGHYHRHQTLGTCTFIGSPYTVTAGEANDGPKGFLVVKDDHSFTRVLTDLRKHVTVIRTVSEIMNPVEGLQPTDLLWIKVSGTTPELDALDKDAVGQFHLGHSNYNLDRDYPQAVKPIEIKNTDSTDPKILLDKIIDDSLETDEFKEELKSFWKEVI